MWQYFPLSMSNLPAKGLQAKEIWQELQDAINERQRGIGIAPSNLAYFSISGNVHNERLFSYGDLANLQFLIEGLAPFYVNYHDNSGVWTGLQPVGGVDWLYIANNEIGVNDFPPSLANWAPAWTFGSGTHNICLPAYANIGDGTNWTRKFGIRNNIQTAYGRVQREDYCAIIEESGTYKIVEYLNEIYRFLNELRWAKFISRHHSYAGFVVELSGAQIVGGDWGDNPDASWTALTGSWDGLFDGAAKLFDPAWSDLITWGPFRVGSMTNTGNPSPSVYQSSANVQRVQFSLSVPDYDDVRRSADCYALSARAQDLSDYFHGSGSNTNEWDDYGLGYLENSYYLIDTIAETINAPMVGALINNDNALPTRPSINPAFINHQVARGYIMSPIQMAVVKFDGPNGFSKIS